MFLCILHTRLNNKMLFHFEVKYKSNFTMLTIFFTLDLHVGVSFAYYIITQFEIT